MGINPKTSEERIPHAWEEKAFASTDLPDAVVIQEEVFHEGREDEVKAVERVLGRPHIFIPRENVDILDPEGIINTMDQTRQLRDYLAKMHDGEAFVEVTNVQAVRSSRMEKAHDMIPAGVEAYLYAMPTVGGQPSDLYRKREIKGALFYVLTQQASFDPAPHEII